MTENGKIQKAEKYLLPCSLQDLSTYPHVCYSLILWPVSEIFHAHY